MKARGSERAATKGAGLHEWQGEGGSTHSKEYSAGLARAAGEAVAPVQAPVAAVAAVNGPTSSARRT